MRIALTCCALLAAGMLLAEDGNANTDLSQPTAWEASKHLTVDEKGLWTMTSPGMLRSKEFIKVDSTEEYQFSVDVKQLEGAPTARFLGGFLLFDKDKQPIQMVHVKAIGGTKTELVAPVTAGDTSMRVKNAARWSAVPYYRVAFNAGPVPNRQIANGAIQSVKREGDAWVVSLNKPLNKNYPVGTAVQIQSHGGYFYTINAMPGEAWKTLGSKVSGVMTKYQGGTKQFWPGTVFVKPMIMPNWNWGHAQRNTLKTVIKGQKLTVNKPAK